MLYELGSLLVLAALSRSASALALVVIGMVMIGSVALGRRCLANSRARQMARIFHDAGNSYAHALNGLRTMAEVVTHLPAPPPTLSQQGVSLLDAYANAAASFQYLVRDLRTMSRDRALRNLTREFLKLKDQESVLQKFQWEVLRVVSAQAESGTVYPPGPIRHYRAAFTVLRHNLPRELWPVMDEVLASCVQLKMLGVEPSNAPGKPSVWKTVPVTFVGGGQAVFSRKHLERALALQMVLHQDGHAPRVFEYTVDHERPV